MAQGQLKRAAVIAGGLAAMAAIGYWGIVEIEPFRHEATSFETAAACAESPVHPRRNSLASDWKDGTLTIRTSVCANCVEKVERVTGQVFGDRVLLKIRVMAPQGAHAACDCEHPLVVRLGQLPQRDYQVLGVPMYSSCE
jgi:hypothetical protein